ncbi:hypothetical protein ACI2OX_22165 [Bacillus sp. N9]
MAAGHIQGCCCCWLGLPRLQGCHKAAGLLLGCCCCCCPLPLLQRTRLPHKATRLWLGCCLQGCWLQYNHKVAATRLRMAQAATSCWRLLLLGWPQGCYKAVAEVGYGLAAAVHKVGLLLLLRLHSKVAAVTRLCCCCC